MTNVIPGWVMLRYSQLWKRFKEDSFTYPDIKKVLRDDENLINVFLSQLKKKGWIFIERNKLDLRRKNYKLKNPLKAIEELVEDKK